jgi:LPXTG-motif cell wall-anchored protein
LPPGYNTQKQLTANVLVRQLPTLAGAIGALVLVLGGAGFLAWRWRRRRGGRA